FAACAAMLAICVAGALVNPSRAAMALLAPILILQLLLGHCQRTKAERRHHSRLAPAVIVALVLAILIPLATIHRFSSVRRWASFNEQFSAHSSRFILWRISCGMCRDAGAWGNGPGTFKILFPHSRHFDPAIYSVFVVTEHVPGRRVSMWSNAHQDY